MIYYLLLILSIILSVSKSSIYNNYAKNAKPNTYGVFKFNALSYFIAATVTLCLGIGSSINMWTAICAVIYGIIVCSLQALSIKAMSIGPMSATALLVLYGMLIPALAGPIFWNEPFSAIQAAGAVLILISMWLLNKKEDKNPKPAAKQWGLYAIICFFLSGMAGIMEKIHQSMPGKDERIMFIFLACSVMVLISLLGCTFSKKRSNTQIPLKITLLHTLGTGVIIGFYSTVNITLAGALDSLIYYPIANGGALLLTMLISVTVFKEKLTKPLFWGFVSGFLSIILLSIPI